MLKVLMVLCLGVAAAFAIGPAFAGEKETSPIAATSGASPNDSKATDLARPNANHNLLGDLAGTWNYVLKISMGPNKPPIETNGVVVRQPIMGGRYFLADFDVEMLPGNDGKSRRHPEAERHENLYHAPTFLIGEHMVKSAPVSALPFLGLLISIRPGCAIARWRCRPSHCLKQGKPGSDVKSGQRAAENRRLLYARVSLRNHPPR